MKNKNSAAEIVHVHILYSANEDKNVNQTPFVYQYLRFQCGSHGGGGGGGSGKLLFIVRFKFYTSYRL